MSMNYKTAQEDFWSGNFGSEYVYRNKSESLLHSKMAMWASMLRAVNKIESARELGCNVGLNLLAIKRLKPSIQLEGYEINAEAVSQAKQLEVADITQGTILEKITSSKVDLTFTCGTLIHINPEYLNTVYENLVSGSNKYVLVAEYYNPTPIKVTYRGYEDRLFKRDFAGDLIDNYGLKLVDYGFIYRRDNVAPQDDVTWFLLEK